MRSQSYLYGRVGWGVGQGVGRDVFFGGWDVGTLQAWPTFPLFLAAVLSGRLWSILYFSLDTLFPWPYP